MRILNIATILFYVSLLTSAKIFPFAEIFINEKGVNEFVQHATRVLAKDLLGQEIPIVLDDGYVLHPQDFHLTVDNISIDPQSVKIDFGEPSGVEITLRVHFMTVHDRFDDITHLFGKPQLFSHFSIPSVNYALRATMDGKVGTKKHGVPMKTDLSISSGSNAHLRVVVKFLQSGNQILLQNISCDVDVGRLQISSDGGILSRIESVIVQMGHRYIRSQMDQTVCRRVNDNMIPQINYMLTELPQQLQFDRTAKEVGFSYKIQIPHFVHGGLSFRVFGKTKAKIRNNYSFFSSPPPQMFCFRANLGNMQIAIGKKDNATRLVAHAFYLSKHLNMSRTTKSPFDMEVRSSNHRLKWADQIAIACADIEIVTLKNNVVK